MRALRCKGWSVQSTAETTETRIGLQTGSRESTRVELILVAIICVLAVVAILTVVALRVWGRTRKAEDGPISSRRSVRPGPPSVPPNR